MGVQVYPYLSPTKSLKVFKTKDLSLDLGTDQVQIEKPGGCRASYFLLLKGYHPVKRD